MNRTRGFKLVGPLAAVTAVGILAFGFSLNAANERSRGNSPSKSDRRVLVPVESAPVQQGQMVSGLGLQAEPAREENNARPVAAITKAEDQNGFHRSAQLGDVIIIGDQPEEVGVGTCPNAGGFPGSGNITQNTNPTLITPGTVACSGDGGATTTANAFARCYSPAVEGVPVGMPVTLNSLTFGIEAVTGMDDVPLDINIYRDTNGCPPPATADLSTAVLICKKSITVDQAQSNMLVTVPLGTVVPADAHFIVEIAQPQDGSGLYAFFPASNAATECGPSYIRSAPCGLPGFNTFASISNPNVHILQSLSATVGGTPSVCGNSSIEGCEQCDPPGPCCSATCISSPTGACCTAGSCSVTCASACTMGGGTYLGDGTNCTGSPCSSGACCRSNGQACTEESIGTCTGGGAVFVPAGTCTPNCCPTPSRLGDDVCATATAPVVAVPGTHVRNGNTLGDVATDVDCDPDLGVGTVVRWESFTINSCANVTIDLCCTEGTRSPLFTDILFNACDCSVGGTMFTADGYSNNFTNGTLPPICTDGNWHAVWSDLPAGTYRYPLFVSGFSTMGSPDEYTMHVTTTACALGRCCNLDINPPGTCTPSLDETTCTAGGGFWGGAGSLCFPPGACGSGACCDSGVCTENESAALCSSHGGELFPGQSCANVNCPPANDDCADRQTITDGAFFVDTTAATTDGPVLASPCGNMVCMGGTEPAGTGCFTNEDCTMGGTCTGTGDNVDMINDVWYNYTAECDGTLFVSACALGICQSGATGDLCVNDSDCGVVGGCPVNLFDSVVAVYQGSTCPPTTLLSCDDDDSDCLSAQQGTVEVSVVGGQTYKIRVGTFLGTPGPTSGILALTVAHRASGGACCNANGSCSHVANAGACASGVFRAGLCCSETTCNAANTCDWNNGPANTGGVASQFAPGEFYAEAADNFIMTGTGTNACLVDSVQFNVSHFNVSVDCVLPGCTNSPTDYASIHLVIYEDATNAAVGVKSFDFDVVPDAAIPDCDGATHTGVSNVQIVNDPGNIVDLDVDLDISHSFVGDVIVELEHTNGDTVKARIVERPGVFNTNSTTAECPAGEGFDPNIDSAGALTDNITAILDDEDTNPVEDGPFPINGRYRPTPDALSVFNGRPKSGTWTLTVYDTQTGDLGTLNAWSLHFTNSGAEAQPKGPDGAPQADGSHIGNMVANLELAPPYNCVPFGSCTGGNNVGAGCINDAPCTGGGTCAFTGSDFQCTPNLASHMIELAKNTKYWLAISPEVPFTGFYQTAVGTSDTFDGNPVQQIFPLLDIVDWTKQGGTDLGFVVNGTKDGPMGCPCTTLVDCRNAACMEDNGCNHATCVSGFCVYTCERYGDVQPPGGNGVVNLDDILCILSGFSNFASCPNADINPCGGNAVINLDDILAVLGAFSGANPCTCTENGTPGGGVTPVCGSPQP